MLAFLDRRLLTIMFTKGISRIVFLSIPLLAFLICLLASCTESNTTNVSNSDDNLTQLLEASSIQSPRNKTLGTPPIRSNAAMTYDNNRQVVIMFGGSNSSNYLNDTWEYDGTHWYQVNTLTLPTSRIRHELAYDSSRQITVLFGGGIWESGDMSVFGDLWEYDGYEWMQIESEEMPSPRVSFVMGYYPPEKAVFIAGGKDDGPTTTSGTNGDAWLYDGHFWPGGIHSQESRNGKLLNYYFNIPNTEMIFDTNTGKLIIVSGGGNLLEFDGSNWEYYPLDITINEGAGRVRQQDWSLSYDQNRDVIVLFGGLSAKAGADSFPLNDTWEYNGTQWYQVNPTNSPTPRYGHAMVYDEARQVIVLFGGIDADGNYLNDTWEYGGTTWIQR
ncbi:MAG: hypothetical protein H6662_00165 [Ardenticatenaceae bacterium]|nr:hypothetical protein [Anaerolineales bacterium]MCB8919969.1 hypothetical protein [Ardenticatenaceae bacterium]MCB8989816.1 hypothetical protein [Ardenticatenaceae bacterium]